MSTSFWRVLQPRLPALLLGVAFGAFAWILPGQLIEINRLLAGDVVRLVVALLSLFLVSISQLALIARRGAIRPILDSLLVTAPALFFALTFVLAGNDVAGTAIVIGAVAVELIVCVGLARRIAARARNAATLTVAWGAVAFAAMVAASWLWPIDVPRALGAWTIIIWGLGLLGVGLAVLFSNRWTALVGLAVIVGSLTFDLPSYEVRRLEVTAADAQQKGQVFEERFLAWLRERPGDSVSAFREAKRPYPVLIASASGGGIYAAAHAYGVLMGLATFCPSLPDHLLAGVGVSGGSYGLALYSSVMADRGASEQTGPCGESALVRNRGLAADHLSPVLAALFFAEVPNAILPGRLIPRDAAIALEMSFEQPGEASAPDAFMREDFTGIWEPGGHLPMLNLVAAEAGRGDRFVVGMYEPHFHETLSDWFGRYGLSQVDSLGVSTATTISARFPWLAPVADLSLDPTPGMQMVDGELVPVPQGIDHRMLADGGYFDNTGAETALDLVVAIDQLAAWIKDCSLGRTRCIDWFPRGADGRVCRLVVHLRPDERSSWSGCDLHIFVGVIFIGERQGEPPGQVMGSQPSFAFSPIWGPLQILLNVNGQRSALAYARLSRDMCARGNCGLEGAVSAVYGFHLDGDEVDLPLGWTLSPRTLEDILDITVKPERCRIFEPDEEESREHAAARSRFGCAAQRIGALLDVKATVEAME